MKTLEVGTVRVSARETSSEAKLDLCSAIRNAASDTCDAAGVERPPGRIGSYKCVVPAPY